jgi:hypothetical protein
VTAIQNKVAVVTGAAGGILLASPGGSYLHGAVPVADGGGTA